MNPPSTEDILALQEMLQTQQKQIEYTKNVMDCLPGSIYWKDLDGRYLGRNRYACLKMQTDGFETEYDPDAVINKTDHDLFEKAIADQFRKNDLTVIRSGQLLAVEESSQTPTGKKIMQLSMKQPLYNAEKEIVGIVGYTLDVTDKKKAEELEKKNLIAKQVIQRLKAISAGLSYEIRSPMAAIRLGLERTKQFFNKLAPLINQTHSCSDPQQRNDVTIEELTDYQQLFTKMIQRIDSGISLMDMQLKNMVTDRIEKRSFQHHEIGDSVQQAVNTFPLDEQSLLNKIHIDIKHRFKILGDRLLTKHVLWNLLNNAFYFMKEEGHGEIFITTEEMIEYYLLRFKDTAKGMIAAEAAQIFEPFYTSRKDGYSLGLHFCQLVMQAYGAKIECWAREGDHTEFLLFFPKRVGNF